MYKLDYLKSLVDPQRWKAMFVKSRFDVYKSEFAQLMKESNNDAQSIDRVNVDTNGNVTLKVYVNDGELQDSFLIVFSLGDLIYCKDFNDLLYETGGHYHLALRSTEDRKNISFIYSKRLSIQVDAYMPRFKDRNTVLKLAFVLTKMQEMFLADRARRNSLISISISSSAMYGAFQIFR